MKSFCVFVDAVEYIEKNLQEPITQEEIAAACCCSLSALQKIWRYCTHTTLKEYISKRRLTRCAEDILGTEMTLTEIAMKYGYNSPEVFSRAFCKLWSIPPSKFKEKWHSSGIFPRIIPDEKKLEGGTFMGRRVDISQLYDELQAASKKDGYVLCFDVVGLDPINKNIGRGAGDSVILEAFKRIDAMAGDSIIAFRVGGDEFAAVTGESDKQAVEKMADKVIELNGRTVEWEGREIPVSLYVSALKLTNSGRHVACQNFFDRIQEVTTKNNQVGRVVYFE
ncbi:MAG: helix-turn-helix domain-containing protein [Bacteroides sp.]|nr:helix-turn-helix domain-containing protein [Bacteroides sp.]